MPAMKYGMSPEEFAEARAAVAAISVQDVALGRVLSLLLLHLGHAYGLDPAVEDARLKAEAEAEAKAAAEAEASAPVVEAAQAVEPSA